MSTPKGAIKKGKAWYTKKTGTLIENTQGAGSNGAGKWFARDKKGNIYYYDPATGGYTSKTYLEGNNNPNVNSWNRQAQEAYYAGQNTLKSNSGKANAQALADLSNRFKTREEAFNFARQHGASGFIWKGGSYNTRSKGESIQAWQDNMNKAKSNGTPEGFTTGKSGIYNNGKYLVGDENGQYHQKGMSNQTQGVTTSNAKVNPGSRKREVGYSSAYDGALFGRVMGTLSPTQQFGAIAGALRGEGHGNDFASRYFDNMYGTFDTNDAINQNKGIFSASQSTQDWANNHRTAADLINAGLDVAAGSAGSLRSGTSMLKSGASGLSKRVIGRSNPSDALITLSNPAVRNTGVKALSLRPAEFPSSTTMARTVPTTEGVKALPLKPGELPNPAATRALPVTSSNRALSNGISIGDPHQIGTQPVIERVQWARPDGTLGPERPFMRGSIRTYGGPPATRSNTLPATNEVTPVSWERASSPATEVGFVNPRATNQNALGGTYVSGSAKPRTIGGVPSTVDYAEFTELPNRSLGMQFPNFNVNFNPAGIPGAYGQTSSGQWNTGRLVW